MSKKLAITGGSRGIGRGIVRRMAKEVMILLLPTVLREEKHRQKH